LLSPYRALDLTNERGLLCGQVLGDLGADVIAVEPPGGSSARRLGPFYRNEPHPDRSLYWWAYSRNKRSVTLDYAKPAGRELLLRLVAGADFLIESERPGAMAALGLGYDELAAVNPKLIHVSITPFGSDGPKAGYADSDIVVWASGGPLIMTGDDDRPPVRVSVPQAYLHAAADGAVAALIALNERARSGLGQHIDISAQQSVTMATFATALYAAAGQGESGRYSGGVKYGPLVMRWVYPARDGYVAISFHFGSSMGHMTRRLMEYIYAQGECDEATRNKDWVAYGDLLATGKETIEEFNRVQDVVADFTRKHTKAELLAAALEHSLLVAPIATIDEVVDSEQLGARDYWRAVEHPEIEATFAYPGPFARFSETPIAYRRRPPLVGEHNRELYVDELGLSEQQLAGLQAERVV
jgi:crotonobetainyl-CoA:carnitine CoA-transferase CaiB-like acyl-CoA transferase